MKALLVRLTSSGEVKFRAVAQGLARIGPRPDVLMTSPFRRAHATARFVAGAFGDIEPKIEPALAGNGLDGIVDALKTHPPDATVALVGHQPMLGTLLARLLGGSHAQRLALRKGGAALVDLPDGPAAPGRLVWFLNPRVLRTLADGTGVTREASSTSPGLREASPKPS